MIQCPKCKFEQPKDVFCAKCGVNMDIYESKRPTFMQRVSSSLAFYGFLVAIAVGGSIFFYLSEQRQAADLAESASSNNSSPTSENQARGENSSSPASTTGPKTMKAFSGAIPPRGAVQTASLADTAEPGDSPVSGTPSPQEAPGVNIEFALVNRDVMEKLSQEGDGHMDIGRYSMSAISQFSARHQSVSHDSNFKSLGQESRGLTMGQPSLVFRGGKDPKSNEAIGFFVDVTPLRQTSDRGVEYKISIKRSLPEVGPTGEMKIISQNFDENVTLAPQSGMAIAGLLPRKQLVEGEDDLYKTNILKAFLEPAFQKGDEEFILLIHPHLNAPTQ